MKRNNEYSNTLMTGLNEALAVSKGNLKQVKRRTVTVSAIPKFDSVRIKKLRESLNLTQIMLSQVLGVSLKTVEAWESGRNTPQGPASRIFQHMEEDAHFLENYHILSHS